jgi:hypothetical protein
MPVELRKRKAHQEAPPAPVRPAKKKAPAKGKKPETEKTVVEQVQEAAAETVEAVKEAVVGKSNGESAATGGAPKVGDTIDLSSFGGEIETNDGEKTTLAQLVEESKGGVVLFTYPKASTPGCKFPSPSHNHRILADRYVIRHKPSLSLPRLLRPPHRNRLLHLRPQLRQPQSQHHLQDEAEASLHPPLRPRTNLDIGYWAEEGAKGHYTGCVCCG